MSQRLNQIWKMKKGLKNYIKETSEKIKKRKSYYYFFGNIPVYIKDSLPQNVDIKTVLNTIERVIPKFLTYDLEMVVVGIVPEFEERQVNAFYKDGTIYVTSEQSDEDDMVDDIVHELAHSVETFASQDIYSDAAIEQEFLGKRTKMFDILAQEGYNIPARYFLDTEYDEDFDMFLYKVVGYPLLATLTMGLFSSPYATTSLREYFAKGFEEYFIGDRRYLKKISPRLYTKISELLDT